MSTGSNVASEDKPIKPKVSGGVAESLAKEVVNKDQTVAAYFLIALALVNLFPTLMGAGEGVQAYIAAGIDLLIGGCIVLGLYNFLLWLKIRLVLGTIFAIILATLGGQVLVGVITLLYTVGLSLLVFGSASKPRRILAYILLGALLLLSVAGAAMLIAGGA